MSKPSDIAYFYNKLDVGILIADEDLTVFFMNDWVLSRIPPHLKNMKNLFELFETDKRVSVASVIKNVIKHQTPHVLSQAFHKRIIPLPDKRFDDNCMRQGGVVTPISYEGKKAALIQIRDESDTVIRILNMKQIQEKLSEKAKELEQFNIELQQNQIELTKAKKCAEAAGKVKNEFLASMSHELRTPLNVINGFAQVLKMCGNITEEQKNQLDMIEQSGNTLLTLINHVLELVKIESGYDLYEPSDVYLKSFLKEICQIAETRSRKKGIRFVSKIDPKLPPMTNTDIHKLHCALMAIFDNALKFTKLGTITFEVRAEVGRICFQIQDTGVGIPEEKLDAIFVAFPERTEYKKEEGAGLGLAVSRKLIEILGGRLQAFSLPGRGSAFSFEIEAPECRPVPDSFSIKKIKGYEGPRRTIMVAEDESLTRIMLSKILAMFGFQIIEAEDGKACIDKAVRERPDLIFMDITMPVTDGLEAGSVIKKIPELASVPIIAVSGHLGKDMYDKCRSAGLDDIVFKPVHAAELLMQCEKYLKIRWIIQDDADAAPSIPEPAASETDSDKKDIVYPPPDQCRKMKEFARLGDIREFKQMIKTVENANAIYHPFVTVVRALLKHYEMKEIIKLLENNTDE